MKRFLPCDPYSAIIGLFFILISCQPKASTPVVEVSELERAYELYKEQSINQRRFKYDEVIHLVTKRKQGFFVEEIGRSVEGKSIYQMTLGKGPTKVMLWSQMHGNESTATMALFDLFNFLEGENDGFDPLRKKLLEKLTLRFIPMVNPDGMDQWIRRNSLDIDLNRDAIKLTSPEAAILKNARDFFSPDFGFNLHDQQIYYTAGETATPATISVLAPAYNYETEVNDIRKRAMQVIVGMNKVIQQIVPGHVGKYDDAFEPRAFGDNFQKWGTSTILIESGGYPNDPEKQEIRRLNFIIMLHALLEIAEVQYTQYSLDDYYSIPDNALRLMDLVIRNLSQSKDQLTYEIDLGIRRRESDAHGSFFVSGVVDDLGDLSVFYGFEELDAKGMEVVEGKIFETPLANVGNITWDKAMELLRMGYLGVKVQNALDRELHNLPLMVLKNGNSIPTGIRTGGNPNFFLAEGGKLRYAIVNGYLIDLNDNSPKDLMQRVQ
ncbi:M14 family metallopeptidase [Cecembia calidifontis]|uniref:Zinc carboxypeptidase n=1 Tax=Cecembia calidifontis TaxID=1187080 RepID=A0A4Q7P979_9BACT|nr:M14 metallopeptidase family protein [Cecembia calidifontis]RZS95292.1 zinc carboxypeptidase [Cecembia calidifontis]